MGNTPLSLNRRKVYSVHPLAPFAHDDNLYTSKFGKQTHMASGTDPEGVKWHSHNLLSNHTEGGAAKNFFKVPEAGKNPPLLAPIPFPSVFSGVSPLLPFFPLLPLPLSPLSLADMGMRKLQRHTSWAAHRVKLR